jgi:hypothetical protein
VNATQTWGVNTATPEKTPSEEATRYSFIEDTKATAYSHCAEEALLKPINGGWSVIWLRKTQARVFAVKFLVSQNLLALTRVVEDVRKVRIS